MEQENPRISAKRRIGRKRRERLEHAAGFQSLGWGLPSDSARRAVNMEGENYAAGIGFWRCLERMNPSVTNSSITRKGHGDGRGNPINSSSRGREAHGVGEGGKEQNLISSIDGDQEKIGPQDEELSDGDEWLEHQDGAGAEVMATASAREAEALPRKHKCMAWWGGFLPQRKLSILLVEGDDSSRKVVSALLRNCDYEVICAENGEEAWEFLCGPTNKVDLVLSEVFMPSLSGITLLCKIMTHGPSKNVPVIMMSSHDSMAVSFKCLSNGAVDFLIKPVRKNELKNIWQHIWRRNLSLDGSNGGEGSQPMKAPQHLGSFCSNADECDMETGYVNAGNESDNGSGTQGSRTGPAITVTKATNVLLKLGARDVDQVNKMYAPASAEHTNAELEPEREDEGRGEYEDTEAREEVEAGWSGTKAVDHIVTSPCEDRSRIIEHHDISISTGVKAPASPSNVPCKESYLYSLELSLKKTEDEGGKKFVHNKALRQSSSSAFSRYSNCANSLSRSSRIDVSHMPAYLNDQNSILIQSNGGTHTQLATPEEKGCSSRVTNDNCSLHPPAPTGLDLFVSPALHKELSPSGFCPLPVPLQYSPLVYDAVLRSYGHLYPMFYSSHPAAAQQPVPCPVVEREGFSGLKASSQGPNLPSDLHLPSYHNHHLQFQHHHGYHFQHALHGNEQAVMDTRSITPTCRSSNRMNLNGTGSFIESATASNNASNDNQGTSHGLNGTLFTSAALAEGGTWYTVDALGCNRTLLGPDENPSSRREAALIKFRQKRNERCFEKKVRYQTRKKMAEQRPRVRGQFVRRAAIAQN